MLATDGPWFRDENGGYIVLRGVCVGGNSKTPAQPDGSTFLPGSLSNETVSFVGRPFPLEEAIAHFRRLKNWGFNAIRFVVTWEAVEHAGPGIYDQAYLDYLRGVLQEADSQGFWILLDMHQDVGSRFCGGDGAPAWAFQKLGLDHTKFDETEAAITMQTRSDQAYPHMEWLNNHNRYACATLLSLFFGGDSFAPKSKVDGLPVQQYLQKHYLGCLQVLTQCLKGLKHLAGFDVFNEPFFGYIGLENLARHVHVPLNGPRITPFDAMALASGNSRKVARYQLAGLLPWGFAHLNEKRHSAFLPGASCVWKDHGVWDNQGDKPALLKPEYFSRLNGRPVNRFQSFMLPFLKASAQVIRQEIPDLPLFVESDPLRMREVHLTASDLPNAVNAHHWYDATTLFSRRLLSFVSVDMYRRRPVLSAKNVEKMFRGQLNYLKEMSRQRMGDCPTVIGEFGMPFNLRGNRAYATGDYRAHAKNLARYYEIIDDLGLNSMLWNYTPNNSHRCGDGWNREDFSIYCEDEGEGRAVEGFSRPYVRRATGPVTSSKFSSEQGEFRFSFEPQIGVFGDTEVFVPKIHFPNGYSVHVSRGSYEIVDSGLTVRINASPPGICEVVLRRS